MIILGIRNEIHLQVESLSVRVMVLAEELSHNLQGQEIFLLWVSKPALGRIQPPLYLVIGTKAAAA